MSGPATRRLPLPKSVYALGFVSLFMDISSEMVASLLPLFLVGTLGASVFFVGMLEGVAEALVAVTKLFSGALSDRLGRRRPMLLFGYGLAAVSRVALPWAGSVTEVMGARLVDRFGKGLRGAPRDALVADLTVAEQRGEAYGMRQSLDTIGAFVGPVIAIVLMLGLAGDIRAVMMVSILPAAVSVLLILLYVREPEAGRVGKAGRWPISRSSLRQLGAGYWTVIAIAAVFAMARLGESFVLLRAVEAGLSASWAPLVMVTMNLVYAATAWPMGRIADRLPRLPILALSLMLLALAAVLLAQGGIGLVLLASLVWGLHLGTSQGVIAALVADAAPEALRGTAFGVFSLISGLSLLAGSAIGGALWTWSGAPLAYGLAATLAIFAATACLALEKHRRRTHHSLGA